MFKRRSFLKMMGSTVLGNYIAKSSEFKDIKEQLSNRIKKETKEKINPNYEIVKFLGNRYTFERGKGNNFYLTFQNPYEENTFLFGYDSTRYGLNFIRSVKWLPSTIQRYYPENISVDFNYHPDVLFGGWKNPKVYLKNPVGDCDDYALGMASIMDNKDIDYKIVTGSVEDTSSGNLVLHAWVEIYKDGEKYITDSYGFEKFIKESEWNKKMNPTKVLMFDRSSNIRLYDENW